MDTTSTSAEIKTTATRCGDVHETFFGAEQEKSQLKVYEKYTTGTTIKPTNTDRHDQRTIVLRSIYSN